MWLIEFKLNSLDNKGVCFSDIIFVKILKGLLRYIVRSVSMEEEVR